MGVLNDLTKIVIEDFDKKDQDVVGKLAFTYNPMVESLTNLFNKNIDFNNLNQQYTTFTTTLDASGIPKVPVQIKYDLKTRLKGIQVISADNLTDNTNLAGSPFITYTVNSNLITINHITGIPADKQYNLSIILIG